MFQYCKFTGSFRNLHNCKSAYKDIGIAMYEAGGSKHDTFHKKRSGIGSHDVGLILEVVCFLADLDEAFPGS
jgi:hypothetical protein